MAVSRYCDGLRYVIRGSRVPTVPAAELRGGRAVRTVPARHVPAALRAEGERKRERESERESERERARESEGERERDFIRKRIP